MLDPAHHKCSVDGEISYESINEGTLWCRLCGRIWDLTDRGWVPDPRPFEAKQPYRKHWNKKK